MMGCHKLLVKQPNRGRPHPTDDRGEQNVLVAYPPATELLGRSQLSEDAPDAVPVNGTTLGAQDQWLSLGALAPRLQENLPETVTGLGRSRPS